MLAAAGTELDTNGYGLAETKTQELNRLRKKCCFEGNGPSAAKAGLIIKAFTYGLKAVPFRNCEFFRKL
jgi:hypothetical protein